MNALRHVCTMGLVATCFILGCASKQQGPAVTGTTGAVTENGSAQRVDRDVVNELSNARCNQEESCNNIGANKKFVTRDVCIDQVRGNIGKDFNAYDCPRGLDNAGVDRCLSAIKGEECSHPLQTLSRYETCRNSAICLK